MNVYNTMLYSENPTWLYMTRNSTSNGFAVAKKMEGSIAKARTDTNGGWGVVNNKCSLIIPTIYDSVNTVISGTDTFLVTVKASHSFAAMDSTGELAQLPDADKYLSFDGTYFHLFAHNQLGFVKADSKPVFPKDVHKIREFGEGLFPALSEGKWGYVDEEGEWRIKASFMKAEPFKNGKALIRKRGYCYFIDKSGQPIDTVKQRKMAILDSQRIAAGTEGNLFLSDYEGTRLSPVSYRKIINSALPGYYIAMSKKGSGVIDAAGKEVVECRYDRIYKNGTGYMALFKGGRISLWSPEREPLRLRRTEAVKKVSDGVYPSMHNGEWSISDTAGEKVSRQIFRRLFPFNSGISAALDKAGWVGIDSHGNELFRIKGSITSEYAGGYFKAHSGNSHYFVDSTGKNVFGQVFTAALPFRYNMARAATVSGWGFLDRKGNSLLPPRYQTISEFKNGTSIVECKFRRGVYKVSGRQLLPAAYDVVSVPGDFIKGEKGSVVCWYRRNGELIYDPGNQPSTSLAEKR